MKKKMVALLLVAAMGIASLAGCGNSKTEDTGTDKNAGGTETSDNQDADKDAEADKDAQADKDADANGEASGEAVTLTYPCIWVGADSKAEVWAKIIAGFNEQYKGQYEIQVEEQTDYDAYRDKIRTLVSAKSTPDIFTVDSPADIQMFAEAGELMDVTAYLEEKLADRFVASAIDSAKIDGKNYSVPYEMAVVPMMYNKKLLDAAGVTEIPTSYEELFEACEKLKESGVIPITQMTNDNAWTSMLWYSYAVAACGGADVYEKGLEDEAFVKAAELLRKMFDYTSSDAVGADASVVNGHFFNERAAIYTNGSWILARIQSEGVEGLYDNLVVGPGLSYEGENGGAYLNSILAYFVFKKQDDPNKQAAVEAFLDYITEPERVLELSASSGSLFAIDYDTATITDPVQVEIVKQSSEASFMVPYFQSAMSQKVVSAFPSALESLVLDEVDAQGFVDMLKSAE